MSEDQSTTPIDSETERKRRQAASMRAWRKANPDKVAAANARARANYDPEQRARNRENCRKWYEANQSEEQRKARDRARAVTKELKKARRDKARSTPEARAKHAAETRAYYAANRDRIRAREKFRNQRLKATVGPYWLKYKYGLTTETLNAMIEAQDNRCLCCRTQFGLFKAHQPYVDHCHKTGRVRGILCNQCNSLLGKANDQPKILRACARYLERFAKQF
jgi:Recombination endonuclease VII